MTHLTLRSSPHEHLVQLLKLGDHVEITAQDWIDQVSLTVQEMLFRLHDPDIALDDVRRMVEVPEWFGRWTFMGGQGLIAPGQTARATVNLELGTSAPTAEPEADLEITISDGGIQVHGHPEAGRIPCGCASRSGNHVDTGT